MICYSFFAYCSAILLLYFFWKERYTYNKKCEYATEEIV
ncbi:hypothetical protein Q604_UNBc4C00228G0001, partial [human gut metagenome]